MAALLRIKNDGKGNQPPNSADSYIERLVKLIPAEVIAVYMLGKDIVPGADQLGTGGDDDRPGWALACLVFTFVLRAIMSVDFTSIRELLDPTDDKKVQWLAVIVATISFALWVYVIGDTIAFVDRLPFPVASWQAKLGMLIWTPLVPYLLKNEGAT